MDPISKKFDTMYEYFIKNSPVSEKLHQKQGIRWMFETETVEPLSLHRDSEEIRLPRGGLLADEMGLGKTIQFIGLMSFRPVKTLIVLPLALLSQWETELRRIAGHAPLVYHGAKKKTTSYEMICSEKTHIVLTTYGEIGSRKRNDDVEYPSILHLVKWGRVIFDEAHHLRNENTSVYRGGIHLEAEHKWLASGTPIQNRPKDLKNLFKIIGFTGSYWDDLLTTPKKLEFIKQQYYLKRTKDDIETGLQPVIERTVNVAWSNKDEFYLSQNIHSVFNFSSLRQGHELDSAIAHLAEEKGVLPLLIRARQSCIMGDMLANCLTELVEKEDSSSKISLENLIGVSSKLDAVEKHIISRRETGSKIVFCHFRKEIDFLQKKLAEKGFSVEKIDGRTSKIERSEIIGSTYDVLILQIQTGCEGLNLQQYSEVYFVSPHWNPAIEDQAIARCHRIGQTQQIYVFRFEMNCFHEEQEEEEDCDDEFVSQTLDFYCNIIQKRKRAYYSII